MAVESAADLAIFFATSDFGVSATLTPGTGSAITLNGIFDNAHQMVDMDNASVSSVAPVFTCRTSDLDGLRMGKARGGDQIVIAGVTYLVRDAQPDGTGVTALILERG